MKVTAIIPDEVILDVKRYTGGKNITDSLIKALNEWLYVKRMESLSEELHKNPVQFRKEFSAEVVRKQSHRI